MSDQEPHKEKVTYIGKVDYRNKQLTFGIKENDRTRHTYVIGKTGMGKSTLLENLIIQDINNGEGVCVIDPHGSLAEKLLDHIPESRVKDVIYFAPFDVDSPIGLNVLEKVEKEKRHLVANGIMAAFKKIWVDAWSARMEYILTNIILALLENDNQSLLGVNRMLVDKEYRKFIVSNVTDPTVKDFWEKEYASYTEKFAAEAAPAIQNKVGQFVGNPLIRNIVGQQKTSIDLRDAMDTKKIIIVNLSKGKVGEGNANLIGSLLITKIYLAAMSRADVGPYELEKLPPFYVYVDEFQNFANESFANILSEARKYNLALTVAHQYVEQMTDEVKAAVFGNVGTMIVFRVGATDAEIFEKEFAPYFILDDIVNLSAFQIYLRLMIDGQGSKPFSAHTLGPIQKPARSFSDEVIAYSRKSYGKPIAEVEEEINAFYKPIEKAETKRDEGKPRDERDMKVREIRHDAPAPRRQPESRPLDNGKGSVQGERSQDPRRDTPSHANSQRGGHQEDRPRQHTEERRVPQEQVRTQPTKGVPEERSRIEYPKTFDEKPALSLKEALAKAMEENRQSSADSRQITENTDRTHDTKKETVVEENKRVQKEIAEEVLRKLIEEES
ncbi:MAG: type IV secretion system DNA-binding domain-containing protein [Candidatus Paceibacterota bacterium]